MLPRIRTKIPRLNAKKSQVAAMVLLRGDRSVRAQLIRDRIAEIRRLTKKIADVEKLISTKVKQSGTTVTTLHGIGFVIAGKVLGEVGDSSRIRSRGAFAMLKGYGATRGIVGRHQAPSPQSRRESPTQLRAPHDRSITSAPRSRHARLRGASADGREVRQGSDKVSQAATLERRFRQLVLDLKGLSEAA